MDYTGNSLFICRSHSLKYDEFEPENLSSDRRDTVSVKSLTSHLNYGNQLVSPVIAPGSTMLTSVVTPPQSLVPANSAVVIIALFKM